MDAETIKVLLIQKSQKGYSPLSHYLGKCGCDCRFATSSQEVGTLLDRHGFDLVLGPIRLNCDSLYPLIGLLQGSPSTLFFSHAVEDGCWWLPALWRGTNCFGARAFRHNEFASVLDETIEEIRSSMRAVAKTQAPMASRLLGPLATIPFSREVSLPGSPVSVGSTRAAKRKASA